MPPDKPPAVVEDKKPVVPTPPPAPVGPLEATIPATSTTVKLVSAGKGKKEALKLTAKPGTKQDVEIALDFTLKQSAGAQSAEEVVPTMVLGGSAETKTAEGGNFAHAFVVSKTDARETAGAKVPMDKFRAAVASLQGLEIAGSVGANGSTGAVTMKIEKQSEATAQAFELVRLTLPAWPAFPVEAVGAGAKWKATTTTRIANRLEVDQVTDYELVSHKNGTWTIKGKTKITGKDQEMGTGAEKAKVSKIAGAGTTEITLADGALYPSHKSSVQTTFTASDPTGAQTVDFAITVGSAITAK
ncbi:MAG: hypothetical protein WKG01_33875 [Kofleriaceae bacterium]